MFKQSRWGCSGGGREGKGHVWAGGEEGSREEDRERRVLSRGPGRRTGHVDRAFILRPNSILVLSTQTLEMMLLAQGQWCGNGTVPSTLSCAESAAAPSAAPLCRSEDQTYPDSFHRWPPLCAACYRSLPSNSFPFTQTSAVFEKDGYVSLSLWTLIVIFKPHRNDLRFNTVILISPSPYTPFGGKRFICFLSRS